MSIHISNVSFKNLEQLADANVQGKPSGFYDSTKKAPWYGNSPGLANTDVANAVQYEDCEDEDDYGYECAE